MAAAWMLLVCGCFIACLGGVVLFGGRLGQPRIPGTGWGFAGMGIAMVVDGIPGVAGWSASVSLKATVLGMVLMVLSTGCSMVSAYRRRARRGYGPRGYAPRGYARREEPLEPVRSR